jgi:beta-glucosidase
MADGLVAEMTATQKYAQMIQVERANLTAALETQYDFGSVYSQGGSGPAVNTAANWADMTNGFRAAALASPLKIPIIYGADEVHGVGTVAGATVFPHNIGLGATRDLNLVAQIAGVIASELQGTGVEYTFAPVVAVARDPRWGRTYESFGETPELASTFGATFVRNLQFTASGTPTGLLASAKHYLGDGGTAGGVNGGNTAGDETALRALHLTPYNAVVGTHVGAVMASYSSWQGVKCHTDGPMLSGVLKGLLDGGTVGTVPLTWDDSGSPTSPLDSALGFGGFVNSDFDACFQLGLTNQTGLGECVNAGVDMFMTYSETITEMFGYFDALVQAGTVAQSRIDDAVRRILAVKCEMGLFASTYTGVADATLTSQVGSAANRMVARNAVQESLVVLQNTGGVLPLVKTATVALAGKSADNTGNQCGGWTITWQGTTGNVVPGATSVRQAFEAVLGTTGVVYSLDGSSTQGATVGVAVIGELPYAEGKGDKTDLALDPADVTAVQTLKQAGLKTVVVLIAGRPMILDTILPYADAVVMAWLPGSEGEGVTDILFGDAHPSGTLPRTWPANMAQIPINVGDANYAPLYPFGFGLTY